MMPFFQAMDFNNQTDANIGYNVFFLFFLLRGQHWVRCWNGVKLFILWEFLGWVQ